MTENSSSTGPSQAGASGRDGLSVVTSPITVVADLLPTSSVPVLLGASALAVGGVVDWPVAAAIGLGYLALRRWR